MYIGKKGEENQTTAAVAPPSTLGLLLVTGISILLVNEPLEQAELLNSLG